LSQPLCRILKQHDYDGAMQDCSEAVRYDRKNAIAFSNRGVARVGGDCDVTAAPIEPNMAEEFVRYGIR
jgi:hypothetical protein